MNINYRKLILVLLLFAFGFSAVCSNMMALRDRRMDRYLKKHLETKNIKKSEVHVTDEQLIMLDFNLRSDQLYHIEVNQKRLGFIFIDEGRSRYEEYTFMVFLTYDLEVLLVRLLEYNETHGVEITNKRWLSQFIGFTPDSEIQHGRNVDAISGATISARSITKAIAEVLKKSKGLKKAGII
ncbi:MAG: hypothetical protein CL663_07165 [Bacteroidetes bacterium]|nr:hypothetical protein [Bacteroidota bacterium]|tara:strand:+ start:74 stop:619 length:546 start_codon:yes stop_codon:yes gene_type:complete